MPTRANTLTFPSSCRSELVAFGALAAAAVMVITFAKKKRLMQPTAEEQAWLDQQLASPVHGLTAEEEKWLDKQVANAEDADMLDDARQAGERRTAIVLHAPTALADTRTVSPSLCVLSQRSRLERGAARSAAARRRPSNTTRPRERFTLRRERVHT